MGENLKPPNKMKKKKSRWRSDISHFERAQWRMLINPYLKKLDSLPTPVGAELSFEEEATLDKVSSILFYKQQVNNLQPEEVLIICSEYYSESVHYVVNLRKKIELENFFSVLHSDIHLGIVLKKIEHYQKELERNWEEYTSWECDMELTGERSYSEYLSLKAKRGNLISKIRRLSRISASMLGPYTPCTIGISKNFPFN